MLYTTLIYGFTFYISIVFCRIFEKTREKNSSIKNIMLILGIVFPPIFVATFRYDIGTDYHNYVHYYDLIRKYFSLNSMFFEFTREPLYTLFTYLSSIIDNSKYAVSMNLVLSCIYMFFAINSILYFKDKISITLGLFIFYSSYYLVYFNIVRQMLAAVIVLYAFRYLWEKKFWKYLLWIVVAGMFHKTAYVLIFLYVFNVNIKFKYKDILYYLSILASPIIIIPLQKVLAWFSMHTGIYTEYLNGTAEVSFCFLLYIVPILILIMLNRKKLLEFDSRCEILIKILFLQIPVQFLGCYIPISDRLSIYFAFFQILLIPMMIQATKEKCNEEILPKEFKYINKLPKPINIGIEKISKLTNKILNTKDLLAGCVIFWYIFYFVVMFIIAGSNGVYPYKYIIRLLKYLL